MKCLYLNCYFDILKDVRLINVDKSFISYTWHIDLSSQLIKYSLLFNVVSLLCRVVIIIGFVSEVWININWLLT